MAAQPSSSTIRTAAMRRASIERVKGNRILTYAFGTVICHSRFRPTLALRAGGTNDSPGASARKGFFRRLPCVKQVAHHMASGGAPRRQAPRCRAFLAGLEGGNANATRVATSEAATMHSNPRLSWPNKPRHDGQTSMARSATRRSSDRPPVLAAWTDIPCATAETNKANAAGSSVAGKSPSFFARMNRFLNASTAAQRRAAISWHTASVLVPPTRIPFTPRQPGGWLGSLSRSTVP